MFSGFRSLKEKKRNTLLSEHNFFYKELTMSIHVPAFNSTLLNKLESYGWHIIIMLSIPITSSCDNLENMAATRDKCTQDKVATEAHPNLF
jgi:hypothetical protein